VHQERIDRVTQVRKLLSSRQAVAGHIVCSRKVLVVKLSVFVVDSVAGANDSLAAQSGRCPRQAKARIETAARGEIERRIGRTEAAASGKVKGQRAAGRFMKYAEVLVAHTRIEREVRADLVLILDVARLLRFPHALQRH